MKSFNELDSLWHASLHSKLIRMGCFPHSPNSIFTNWRISTEIVRLQLIWFAVKIAEIIKLLQIYFDYFDWIITMCHITQSHFGLGAREWVSVCCFAVLLYTLGNWCMRGCLCDMAEHRWAHIYISSKCECSGSFQWFVYRGDLQTKSTM